jgi:uncharacterized membrane protein
LSGIFGEIIIHDIKEKYMMKKPITLRFLSLTLVLTLAGVLLAACGSSTPSPAEVTAAAQSAGQAATSVASGSPVSYAKDILPLMQTACVNCHGGEKTSKGLDLKSYASMMAGSQNGAVITPGNAAQSNLIASVQSGKMPKRGVKLTADQIQMLVNWVNAGATNN